MDRQGGVISAFEHTLLDAVCDIESAALFAVDGDDLLLHANRQIRQFFQIPDIYLQPGTRLRDLLGAIYDHTLKSNSGKSNAGKGNTGSTQLSREDWLSERVAAHWRERHEIIDKTVQKRLLRFVTRRLPSGLGLCLIKDVTERKHREDEWRTDMDRVAITEAILDGLPQPVLVCDSAWSICAVNRSFTALTGERSEQLLGRSLSDIIAGDIVEKLIARSRTMQEGETFRLLDDDTRGASPLLCLNGVRKCDSRFHVLSMTADPAPALIRRIVKAQGAAPITPAAPLPQSGPPMQRNVGSGHDRLKEAISALPIPDGVGHGSGTNTTKPLPTPRQDSPKPHSAPADKTLLRAMILSNDPAFSLRAEQILTAQRADVCSLSGMTELRAFLDLTRSIDISIDLAVIDPSVPAQMADLATSKTRRAVICPLESLTARLCDETAPAAAAAAQAVPEIDILVAEDNEVNQIVFSQILEGLGYRYGLAATAREAFAEWQKKSPPIMLIDISLPDMTGLDLARKIRSQETSGQNRTVLIGVLVPAFHQDRAHCLEAGMDDVIIKPVSPDMIRRMIERHSDTLGRLSQPS
ncbi:response regulator [Allorhizobium sp. BGMRC 0089]|uniref:response regulator n=1 Tax=Allorhizobium sonneratiae TaxID=2934936 RepID=UPI00203402A2|nr:response regulator [Allorhizobium sonneratiae]MCM2291321.1 response regulator [Allorhizobium sonneratiae]